MLQIAHYLDILCKIYLGLKLHFVGDLEPTPISNVQMVYIFLIIIFLLYKISECWI